MIHTREEIFKRNAAFFLFAIKIPLLLIFWENYLRRNLIALGLFIDDVIQEKRGEGVTKVVIFEAKLRLKGKRVQNRKLDQRHL